MTASADFTDFDEQAVSRDTVTIRCTVTDADNTAVNLTGATITAVGRTGPQASDTQVFSLTVGSGITVVGVATNGIFDVKVPASSTTSFTSKTVVYTEIGVVLNDGTDQTLRRGRITFSPTIT